MSALNATACGEEAADDAGDVTADVEFLRVIDTNTLYAQAETPDAVKHHGLAFGKFLFQQILQLRRHADDRTF